MAACSANPDVTAGVDSNLRAALDLRQPRVTISRRAQTVAVWFEHIVRFPSLQSGGASKNLDVIVAEL